MQLNVFAQLRDGSVIAPDFTITDLDGNTWNLYEILDQGKSVVIDFSTTWCGPCWRYHESKILEDVYEKYGPDGTDEIMVFFIEADESTDVGCLYGPSTCNRTSYGDWTAGTKYPIADDAAVADLYQIFSYPSIYHICPNRIITRARSADSEEFYEITQSCEPVTGENNIAIRTYDDFSGSFCNTQLLEPEVTIQNMGSENITSLTATLELNDEIQEVIEWTGELEIFQTNFVNFAPINVDSNTEIVVKLSQVNGVIDDNLSDNSIIEETILGTSLPNNIFTLNIQTGSLGGGIGWELITVDYYRRVLYKSNEFNLTDERYDNNSSYSYEIALPKDGLYELKLHQNYNSFSESTSSYQLSDANGQIIADGLITEKEQTLSLCLSEAETIDNNAKLVSFSNLNDYQNLNAIFFCDEIILEPRLSFRNIGATTIRSLELVTIHNSEVVDTHQWNGSVSPNSSKSIYLEPTVISESKDITYAITKVNGEADIYTYNNEYVISLNKQIANDSELLLEFVLDDSPYEFYWEIVNEEEEIITSGGNELVGESGAEIIEVTPDDPGAYFGEDVYQEAIILPETTDYSCYTLRLIDEGGNGFSSWSDALPYFKLQTKDGETLYHVSLSGKIFREMEYEFGFEEEIISSNEYFSKIAINISPNPTQDHLYLELSNQEQEHISIDIYSLEGKLIKSISREQFVAGRHQLSTSITDLKNGLYFLKVQTQGKSIVKKLIVAH